MGPRLCLPVLGKGAAGSRDPVRLDEVGPRESGVSYVGSGLRLLVFLDSYIKTLSTDFKMPLTER